MSDPMDRFISILKGEKPLDWLHPAEFEQIGEELDRLRADNARLTVERDEANVGAGFADLSCDRKDLEINQLKARVAELEHNFEASEKQNSAFNDAFKGLEYKLCLHQSALKEAEVALEWMVKFGREHGSKCVCLRCEKTSNSLATINKALEGK